MIEQFILKDCDGYNLKIYEQDWQDIDLTFVLGELCIPLLHIK